MRAALLLLALVVLASAAQLSERDYQRAFARWTSQYNKQYAHDQFFNRYNVFKANLDSINAHNAGNHSYTKAMNEFGDLTAEEFYATHLGYSHVERPSLRSLNTVELKYTPNDDSLDWRDDKHKAVTSVKNQGQCGSCYSFSAMGSVEGVVAQNQHQLVDLAEQQIVDCSKKFGNDGCNGGLMDQVFEYLISTGYACTEASYPYTAKTGKQCKTCSQKITKPISGYKDVPANDENQLMEAIKITPVSIAIEADQDAFQFYSGGVFDEECGTNLDHGVLLVGYGTDAGKDYWIVKNSWGAQWGEQGYIRVIRGRNICGIAAQASYPTA